MDGRDVFMNGLTNAMYCSIGSLDGIKIGMDERLIRMRKMHEWE